MIRALALFALFLLGALSLVFLAIGRLGELVAHGGYWLANELVECGLDVVQAEDGR